MLNVLKKIYLCTLVVITAFVLFACVVKEYKVIFNTDGGSIIESVKVVSGAKVSKPNDPIKTGFVFEKWYSDADRSTEYQFDKEVLSNLTLYAGYKALAQYTVTFDTIEVKVYDGDKVVKPANPKKDGFSFVGWYLDENCTNEYDFNKAVTSDIKLYSSWSSDYVTVVYDITYPNSYNEYLSNKSEQDNKRTEFIDLNQTYFVGDDNAWQIKPITTFANVSKKDYSITIVTVDKWSYQIKVKVLENDQYVEIGADSSLVTEYDYENCSIDFSDEAVGKSFEVIIIPDNLTEKQLAEIDKKTIIMQIKVIDGYNAYTEKELAYIENRIDNEDFSDRDREAARAWLEYKKSNGLTIDYAPNAIILHNDMVLDASSVPEMFFYTADEVAGAADAERSEGSMKDYYAFYFREVEENGEFHIYGNYFTINSKNFREVTRANGEITKEGEVISHATLLRFEGSETGTTSIENLSMFGNAPRVDNTIKAGGHIFLKVEGPSFTAYNNIAASLFITYMPNRTFTSFVMDKCKAYDAFNSFIYNWGSDKVYIKNCEMIGAGGPVIIQDHIDAKDADGGDIAKTYIENSKLESFVTGSEGWFSVVKATSMVPGIKGLNALFIPFGRSYLKSSVDQTLAYMNLICVNKSGSAESFTSEKIKGTLKIDNYQAFDFGETNPYLSALLESTFSMSAPAFQTSASTLENGYAYTDGATGIFDLTNKQIIDPTNNIYKGEYICMYYMGMSFTLGFYNVGDTYTAVN